MQVMRIPGWEWWPDYETAEYYGRRHSLAIGCWLIFWGQMTDADIEAWETARMAK
jgi:hypothetical protein